MAAGGVVHDSRLEQFCHNQAYHRVHKCFNCVKLESQLKEAFLELSSSQFIIKLLYKELNEATAKHTSVRSAITENGVCEESVVATTWSKVASKYSCGKNESVNSEMLQTWQPVPVTNRYSVLSNLPESTIEDEAVPSRSEKLTQLSTNYYKKNREQRRTKNSLIKHHSAQRPPSPIYHVPGGDHVKNYKTDPQPNRIPTLVNGQVSSDKKDGNSQCVSDNVSYIQFLLRESSRKLLVNKKRFSNCRKHKVLLVGDSHLRGCAAHMKVFSNDQFEVLGHIKPGATSKFVMESVKSDTDKLTMDDFLIMCSGSNDVNRNDLRKVFNDVTSFVKSVDQTNIILIGIPYRYDFKNSHINSEIKSFNRKLYKLTKIFSHVNVIEADSNRLLFTKHGLHLNGLGKELLSNHLLLHIYSALEEDTGSPITLAWQDGYLQVSSSSTASCSSPVSIFDNQDLVANDIIMDRLAIVPCLDKEGSTGCVVDDNINVSSSGMLKTRTSSRVKKAPVTKKEDFLW